MAKEQIEIIAEIISSQGKSWKVLEYNGGDRSEMVLQGEFGQFQTTLQKAVSSGYHIVWCAEDRLSKDWKARQPGQALSESSNLQNEDRTTKPESFGLCSAPESV